MRTYRSIRQAAASFRVRRQDTGTSWIASPTQIEREFCVRDWSGQIADCFPNRNFCLGQECFDIREFNRVYITAVVSNNDHAPAVCRSAKIGGVNYQRSYDSVPIWQFAKGVEQKFDLSFVH